MRPPSGRIVSVIVVIVVLVAIGGCGSTNGSSRLRGKPPGTQAVPDNSPGQPAVILSTVGPLFNGSVNTRHFCTASVLDSPTNNLILTAAHCLSGSGAGLLFVPDYRDGSQPYGVWTVQRAFAEPQWVNDQNPAYDYAILQVADQERNGHMVGVESLTGGNELGTAPTTGQTVTVAAYNAGLNDEKLHCPVAVRFEGTYPAIDCGGFSSGSSGGPWLAAPTNSADAMVTGIIGGLDYGGCHDATSYSSPFATSIQDLLKRAAAGTAPSVMPKPRGDGC